MQDYVRPYSALPKAVLGWTKDSRIIPYFPDLPDLSLFLKTKSMLKGRFQDMEDIKRNATKSTFGKYMQVISNNNLQVNTHMKF